MRFWRKKDKPVEKVVAKCPRCGGTGRQKTIGSSTNVSGIKSGYVSESSCSVCKGKGIVLVAKEKLKEV